MEGLTPILVALAFMLYFAILQLQEDVSRRRMQVDATNKILEGLRTKYQINIRVFRTDKPLYGFAWFNEIWITELALRKEGALKFIFHHERYHLKRKHKQWTILARILVAFVPVSGFWLEWYYVVGLILFVAYMGHLLSEVFEKKANQYADKHVEEKYRI